MSKTKILSDITEVRKIIRTRIRKLCESVPNYLSLCEDPREDLLKLEHSVVDIAYYVMETDEERLKIAEEMVKYLVKNLKTMNRWDIFNYRYLINKRIIEAEKQLRRKQRRKEGVRGDE